MSGAGAGLETAVKEVFPMGAHASLLIARDLEAIEGMRAIWEGWHHHPNSDIDFYLTILSQRREILRPHVTVLRQHGSPRSMLIGRLERIRFPLKLGYLGLPSPMLNVLTLPFGGLLGDDSQESCELLVREVVECLRRGEADAARFEPVRLGSPLYETASRLPDWRLRDHTVTRQVHRIAEVPRGAEAFYLSLSPKARKNIRWQAKKLVSEFGGDVKITCYRTAEELDAMIADVETIAQKTYQRGLGVGFNAGAEMRSRLNLEAHKGWLRGYVLHLGGKPAVFWLGDVYKGVFHSNFMGYDPAYAEHSPGMYLVSRVFEEMCEDSAGAVQRVDFGLGDAQYKQVLGSSVWEESGIWIYAPSLKGYSVSMVQTGLGKVDGVLRRALKKTNLLQRVKGSWRKSVREARPQDR